MKRLVLCLAMLVALPAAAQTNASASAAAPRALTPRDFDRWQSIEGERLSDDGTWVAYSLVPQVGEGEVVVRPVRGTNEFRHSRGYIGRPQTRPGAGRGPAFNAPPAQFFGSQFVAFTIEPPQAEVEAARRQKKRPADQPKSSLGIMRLSDGNVTVIERVKSFEAPRGDARFLVYLMHPADSSAERTREDTTGGRAAATPGGRARPIADSTTRGRPKKEYGSVMVIRELATGAEVRVEDVLSLEVDPKGAWIAYAVSSRDSTKDGVYLRPVSGGEPVTVASGTGHYKQLAFDKSGAQLAYVSDRAEAGAENARYALYVTPVRSPSARAIVSPDAFSDTLIVSDRADLEFSEDGSRLQFGVAPPPLDSIPADSLADKAVFDLWHWKDMRLQPQQRVEAERDRNRSYPAVADIKAGRFHVLGNDTLTQIRFGRDLRVGVGMTSVPYAVESMWGEGGDDVYLVNATNGTRTLIAQRIPFNAQLSPDSRYVIYFDEHGDWKAYAIATGKTVNLTEKLEGVRFDQETWDTPSTPAPWGVAGWTTGDRTVLVYDRYDIWEIDPTGSAPARMVTDSLGRTKRTVLRYVQLDTAAHSIDPKAPLMLTAHNEVTKASGVWLDRLGVEQMPESLYMADRRISRPEKAGKADVLLFTSSTFREFPDLYVSGMTLRDAQRVSAANPQQKDFKWGTAQLVEWRNMDGVPLQGILYKPDDFDPSKQYPMVVYFYEQLSDNLYAHQTAVPRNTIQPTLYVSNGYLAFFPDIAYTEGYPGASALKSIVPGVQMLIDSGFVKTDGIGISGQSWGGYQTAYIITRTNLFSAAFAGAPVANMTSAYGGIRWESGRARAFQYERTQSRIGGSLWDMPMRYLENSPLFSADRIQTPLMMMHNDGDGAVPWYQGIEMFVAMRRLGKEAYLINYNNDAHNPTKRANQIDVAMRQMQFFDHHLKGKPAPDWMEDGIPFLQKGREIATPQPTVTEEKVSSSPE